MDERRREPRIAKSQLKSFLKHVATLRRRRRLVVELEPIAESDDYEREPSL